MIKKEVKKKTIPWYKTVNKNDFVDIELSKVDLDLDEHKFGYIAVGSEVSIKQIAVIEKNNGRYTLLAGFKQFVNAKIRNEDIISAYIFNGTREEFDEKYQIINK